VKGIGRLSRKERLQLMRFVCAAVWSDLEVSPSERTQVLSLALRMGLPEDEMAQVQGWIEVPPPPEDVDPNDVPAHHRRLFLEAFEETMKADAVVDTPEAESLRLLRELLATP
jgi:hypothetical protein